MPALPARLQAGSSSAPCLQKMTALAILVLASVGCGPWRHSRPATYRTLAKATDGQEEKAIAHNRKAEKLFSHGKLDAAAQVLQDALIADVGYGPAHNNLGKVYFAQGKYYLAAWEFEYASRLMPERADPVNNLGQVFEATNRLETAIEYYDRAYALAPQDAEIIGNLARARLKQEPTDPAVHYLLAELLMHDTRPTWVAWAREHLATTKDPPLEEPKVTIPETHGEESLPPPPKNVAPIVGPAHAQSALLPLYQFDPLPPE